MHLSEVHGENIFCYGQDHCLMQTRTGLWNFIGAMAIDTPVGLNANVNPSILILFSVVFNLWVGLLG